MIQRRKPPRLQRIFCGYDAALFFVTMITWKRQPVLNNERAHDAFVAHARKQEANGAIGRYVLLPDHAHLFISIRSDRKLSDNIKHLKQSVTKALRVQNAQCRIWQPGFFDHLLRSGESYEQKWEYVRENPVRAGLVARSEDWPYQGEIVRIRRW